MSTMVDFTKPSKTFAVVPFFEESIHETFRAMDTFTKKETVKESVAK